MELKGLSELKTLREKDELNAKIFDAINGCFIEEKSNDILVDNLISVGEFDDHTEKKSKETILRSKIKTLFVELENFGLGKWKVGRRGFQSRFQMIDGLTTTMIYNSSLGIEEQKEIIEDDEQNLAVG